MRSLSMALISISLAWCQNPYSRLGSEQDYDVETDQRGGCWSVSESRTGGWRPISTAPRDGTAIEILGTKDSHPWFDVFKWTSQVPDKIVHTAFLPDFKGTVNIQARIVLDKPMWVSIYYTTMQPSTVIKDSKCLFWRPYKIPPKTDMAKYCASYNVPYDKEEDRCVTEHVYKRR